MSRALLASKSPRTQIRTEIHHGHSPTTASTAVRPITIEHADSAVDSDRWNRESRTMRERTASSTHADEPENESSMLTSQAASAATQETGSSRAPPPTEMSRQTLWRSQPQ